MDLLAQGDDKQSTSSDEDENFDDLKSSRERRKLAAYGPVMFYMCISLIAVNECTVICFLVAAY